MSEPKLEAWVREEQAVLWHDLDEAIRGSINGAWSIRASGVAGRIVGAARLVGVTPAGEVPYSLVAGGVYEAVQRAGGLPVTVPTDAEMDAYDLQMAEHAGTRATLRPAYMATVAAIARDAGWIRDAS